MRKKDLLIEIGTEELPPKALSRLARALADEIHAGLEQVDLGHAEYHWYATPRRLAVVVKKLVAAQEDHEVVKRGPALTAAYDPSGNPTSAAEGFARSCNITVSDLERLKTDKGSWLVHRSHEHGKSTSDLLPAIIETALKKLPIPKRMRWGDHATEFVRPVHWSVVLFGNEVVPCSIMGTSSGNITYGHRFHYPKKITLRSVKSYLSLLREKGCVIADFAERKDLIRTLAIEAGEQCGGRTVINEDLLDEVTSLVEWPVVIVGSFEQKFLKLPPEVLIATMQGHQKYFPVRKPADDGLINHFIAFANIQSHAPDEIRRGNERVIHPRLSDAAFFWERDCRVPLADLVAQLAHVVFQQKLGTLADKSNRLQKLSAYIAQQLQTDPAAAERAAALAKCDLLTQMVGEFPELQGVVGRYYALENGETSEVATALDEQYLPRFAGDRLPITDTGKILSIADKLDSLVGCFAIDQVPSGDKDPFALRRAALGCVRIMIECRMGLDLVDCLKATAENFDPALRAPSKTGAAFDFIMERLRRYYLDSGISADVFESVLACKPSQPYDFHLRINAVTGFIKLPEATSLAAANKRIENILKQAGNGDPDLITPTSDGSMLVDNAEIKLHRQLDDLQNEVELLLAQSEYTRALSLLSSLKNNVDDFFDQVMVMVEDDGLRTARLQMLARIRHLFKKIADISRLQSV